MTPPPLVPVPPAPEAAPSESEEEDPYGGYDDEEEPEKEEAPRGELFPREPESPSARGRASRVVATSLLGLLGEIALGAPAAYLGFLAAYSDEDSGLGLFEVVGLSFVGVTLGASLGVTGGGELTGGEGRFHVALGGACLGALVGALAAIPAAFAGGGAFIVPLVLFPVAGAVIAYEMSHGTELEARKAGATVQVVPLLGVRPSGGLVAGLAGSF